MGGGKVILIGFSGADSSQFISNTRNSLMFSLCVEEERLELRCFMTALHACHRNLGQCS